ncbi:hypothetical protein BDV29DRAFT_182479 [Aspergillus leporis]|jgi:hypothetical protein|uniref:SWIM-type domain-containing protein n=1 Tax=Aspergillus leporis TaxID=41062 RepID=A0A5N5WPB6_9EURO|nr:hypothetical protein BDV29DRAFT_182479 [Aspergillus leporis]
MQALNTNDTLPPTIQFIEQLISQLSNCATDLENEDNTQSQLPSSGFSVANVLKLKPLMLTLHCLFPNEILLALDILDRGLVRRFVREDSHIIRSSQVTEPSCPHKPTLNGRQPPPEDMFFVISASIGPRPSSMVSPSMSLQPRADQKGYEVRLQAWNCTCPTFTLAAFRDLDSDLAVDNPSSGIPESSHTSDNVHYPFGGGLTRPPAKLSFPVCKHLLACVLLVRCPGLLGATGNDSGRTVVSAEELAGWCAGWGG